MARGRRRQSDVHGVLVVDKPSGPTSHDVVARVRRALGTRSVGHAGTLDPLATGVLVVAVGEATKLVPYLTAGDKRYEADVALGAETDTLDAAGEVVARAAVPEWQREQWQRLAEGFVGRHLQQVPRVSAVRVDGQRLHERARRGEDFEPPTREVVVHELRIEGVAEGNLRAEVHCAKGFFVRSWARDLARAAGTLAHLSALRRTESGGFGLVDAVSAELLEEATFDQVAREALRSKLLPLARACERTLPWVRISGSAVSDCFHGRPVSVAACQSEPPEGVLCLGDEDDRPLAIARREADQIHVVRGFRLESGQP